jgi:hypothetical protein
MPNTSPGEIQLATSVITYFIKGSNIMQTSIHVGNSMVDGIKIDLFGMKKDDFAMLRAQEGLACRAHGLS